MKFFIGFLTLGLFVLGCSKDKEEGGFKLIKGELISFPVNDLASPNAGTAVLFDSDSGEHLFLYNHIIKQLQISEFPSNTLKLNIPLNFDQAQRVKSFSGGTLIAKDSIFVTFYPPAIGLIDFEGKLLHNERVGEDSYKVSHIGNGSSTPLFLVEGKMYGAQPFLMDHHRMKAADIQKQHLVYSYDMASNSFQWHDVFYRKGYWDEGKKLHYFAWVMRDDKIYLAPYFDHEIQVFDPHTNTVIEKKEVKSAHVNKFNIVNEMPGSPEEAVINTLQSDQYETFIYDKYRDVFYRIFLPGMEVDQGVKMEQLRLMERSRQSVGVMVLDKDLNVLSEYVFDNWEVHPQFLVGKRGLYVSTNNMYRDDFSDDYASYQLMVLE